MGRKYSAGIRTRVRPAVGPLFRNVTHIHGLARPCKTHTYPVWGLTMLRQIRSPPAAPVPVRPGSRARPRPWLARERGGRSVSAPVARGACDGFCCAGRGDGPRRSRCGGVPAFHTEGTHAAQPVLGRGPLSRVGLTTNQLEDRRWPTLAFVLHLGATRFGAVQQFSWLSASSWVLPFFVLVPRCIWAVACIWLTQFVGCNNFEFRNNLSGVTAL